MLDKFLRRRGPAETRRPPSARRRWRWRTTVVVLCALPVPGARFALATPASELAPPGRCADATDALAPPARQEAAMRCLINFARATHDLSPLRQSPVLGRSAAHKNALMLGCGQFAHDACGDPWARVFVQAGYSGPVRGENIAWASAAIAGPRQIMDAWLHSPEHRRNILRPGWTDQGLSVRVDVAFQGVPDASVWTSQFGQSAGPTG